MRRLVVPALLALALAAGCGESGGSGGSTKNPTLSGKVPPPQPTTRTGGGTTTTG